MTGSPPERKGSRHAARLPSRCRSGRETTAGVLIAALALTLTACQDPPPEESDLAYHRGRNALALGRYDWARRYFAEDLESHPERSESLRGMGLGWISGNEGSLTRSIEAFSAYLERVPDDVEIRVRLARSWRHLGEVHRTLVVLEAAGASAEVSQLRARTLENADPAAAEVHVGEALSREPQAFDALILGARLAHRRGDGELALERALAAARADPLKDETFYLLAQIRRGLGDEDGARRDLDTYQMLRRLPGRGRPSKLSPFEELQVLRSLERRLEPTARPLRLRWARLLLVTGDPDARSAIEGLIAEETGDAIPILELAREAHSRGHPPLARGLYQRALELDPELKAARAQLARLEHENGKRDTARRLLAEGLAADPHYAPYHFVSGLVELADRNEPRAVEAFERALELAPWLAAYRLALADIHLAAGRRDELRRLLDETPAADPAIGAYRRRHLGE